MANLSLPLPGVPAFAADDADDDDEADEGEEADEADEGAEEDVEDLLRRLLSEAQELVRCAEVWTAPGAAGASVRGRERFIHRVTAERRFLTKIAAQPQDMKVAQLRSTNLPWLWALLQCAVRCPGVVGVLQTLGKKGEEPAEVDVLAQNGRVWVKVKAMSRQRLRQTEAGNGSFGEKGVVDQARKVLAAARSRLDADRHVPTVVFVFTNGCTTAIASKLQADGVTVVNAQRQPPTNLEGLWPSLYLLNIDDWSVVAPNTHANASRTVPSAINLDITCLLALISHTSHPAEAAERAYTAPYLQLQYADELVNPVMLRMQPWLDNSTLVVCETAYTKFVSIVGIVAGPKERERAEALLQRLTRVSDDPSTRAMSLPLSRKITNEQRMIFGTADKLGVVTVTANATFVAAAGAHGVSFDVEMIGARALSEWNLNACHPYTNARKANAA